MKIIAGSFSMPHDSEQAACIVARFLNKYGEMTPEIERSCDNAEWMEAAGAFVAWGVVATSGDIGKVLRLLQPLVRLMIALYVMGFRKGQSMERRKGLEFVCVEEEAAYRRN
jgi:hypothetical protein